MLMVNRAVISLVVAVVVGVSLGYTLGYVVSQPAMGKLGCARASC
jgi:hypothetical protein